METTRLCRSCQKPLPTEAPMGLCPECLIKSGFNTGTEPGAGGDSGFVPPPVEEIAKLFPQFEVLAFIGKGGMGAVYKARQPGLDRFVALKILPPRSAEDPGFAERFNREARALARLSHPNIVAVHDFGNAGTLHYLVMELVDGANLREIGRAGRLAPAQALQIVPQICDALQFAHNEGIVHRDIKPENILLDKRGRVKITDFGIAKMIGAASEKVALTGAKDVVGTPHYMAPEQIEKPMEVDHRADIYSLGVVFYELLTGELPLGRFASPSRKVQVDVRLDDVVLRALEKEPERRYQQASQVKADVETITATPRTKPPPVEPALIRTESTPQSSASRPRVKGFVPFAMSAVVALAVFLFVFITALMITFIMPEQYVAVARIMPTGSPTGSTAVELIKSDAVLSRVNAELDLAQRWGRKYGNGRPLDGEMLIKLLRGFVEVREVRDTSIIEVRCYSNEPNEAAEIANKVVESCRAIPGGFPMQVVDQAVPTQHPARPNKRLNFLLGAAVGTAMGLLAGVLTFALLAGRARKLAAAQGAKPSAVTSGVWTAVAIVAAVLALLFVVTSGLLLAWLGQRHENQTKQEEQSRRAAESLHRSDQQAWREASSNAVLPLSSTNSEVSSAAGRLRARRAAEAATPESAYYTGAFSNRFQLAAAITAFPKRDTVLAALARDAAEAGDFEMATTALKKITAFTTRDKAIRECARAFNNRGQRPEALELVRTITSFKEREAALEELAR